LDTADLDENALNLALGSCFAVDLPGVFRDLIVDDLDLQGAVGILGILQVAREKQISLVFQFFALRRIVGSDFSQWVGSHKTKYTPFTPLFAVGSELVANDGRRAGKPVRCATKLLSNEQFLRINLREAPPVRAERAYTGSPWKNSRRFKRRLAKAVSRMSKNANVYRQLHKYSDGVLDDGARKCGLQDVPQHFEPARVVCVASDK